VRSLGSDRCAFARQGRSIRKTRKRTLVYFERNGHKGPGTKFQPRDPSLSGRSWTRTIFGMESSVHFDHLPMTSGLPQDRTSSTYRVGTGSNVHCLLSAAGNDRQPARSPSRHGQGRTRRLGRAVDGAEIDASLSGSDPRLSFSESPLFCRTSSRTSGGISRVRVVDQPVAGSQA